MNKNLLIKQNNELFNKIHLLKSKNLNLTSQINALNEEIKGYLEKIEELEAELAALKTTNTDIFETKTVSDLQEDAVRFVPEESEVEQENIELPEDFNYASNVIGDIVIKAAGYINELSVSNNENKKELINLLLGRTEIAKAEILNIVTSEVGFSAKQELIDTQYAEAVEYFKSIMEQ